MGYIQYEDTTVVSLQVDKSVNLSTVRATTLWMRRSNIHCAQENDDVFNVVYTTTYTWRNPANGIEVSGPNSGPDRIVANADGSTTVHVTGVLYLAQPHGGQPVLHNAGRTV